MSLQQDFSSTFCLDAAHIPLPPSILLPTLGAIKFDCI